MGAFPKSRGPFFGGPHSNMDFDIFSLYWGAPIFGNYHVGIT